MSHRVARFVREQVGVFYEIDTGTEPAIHFHQEGNTETRILFQGKEDDPSVKVIILVEPQEKMPMLGEGVDPWER